MAANYARNTYDEEFVGEDVWMLLWELVGVGVEEDWVEDRADVDV